MKLTDEVLRQISTDTGWSFYTVREIVSAIPERPTPAPEPNRTVGVQPNGRCIVGKESARVCELGTHGCVVGHAREPEPFTDPDSSSLEPPAPKPTKHGRSPNNASK